MKTVEKIERKLPVLKTRKRVAAYARVSMESERMQHSLSAQVTLSRFTAAPINSTKKRRVAAYARVSTDNEEQLTSYEAQVDYYTNYIKGRDDWEFAGVYTDVDTPYGQNPKSP